MKKFGLLAISLAVSVSLAACGKTTNNQNQEEITTPVKTEQINDSSFYFTANHNGISKVDTASNKVVETIAIEGAVHNVQISPDGKTIAATLVPSSGSHGEQGEETHSEHGSHDEQTNGLALFYDAKTNKLIKQVEVGSHPAHIVFTKNNKYALVTNNEDNNVSIIDLASYKLIHNISTGKGPHGFRISQDSNNAYIANMGEDTVSVIDLNNLKETRKIKVGLAPVTTGVTSDGKLLVTTLNGENSLAIIDLTTSEVEKVAVGEGPAQVYIQSDDKYAFVANQGTPEKPSSSVTKIDLETKEVAATIEVGKGAHGVTTSGDNQFVYITNMYENTVSVIDNNKNKVIATVEVGEEPNGITIQ